jgi:hypothetical protein
VNFLPVDKQLLLLRIISGSVGNQSQMVFTHVTYKSHSVGKYISVRDRSFIVYGGKKVEGYVFRESESIFHTKQKQISFIGHEQIGYFFFEIN